MASADEKQRSAMGEVLDVLTCSRCGKVKAREMFRRSGQSVTGVEDGCMECRKAYTAHNFHQITRKFKGRRLGGIQKFSERVQRVSNDRMDVSYEDRQKYLTVPWKNPEAMARIKEMAK